MSIDLLTWQMFIAFVKCVAFTHFNCELNEWRMLLQINIQFADTAVSDLVFFWFIYFSSDDDDGDVDFAGKNI